MLNWSLTFLVIGLIVAVLGLVFLVLFLVRLVAEKTKAAQKGGC